MDPHHATTNRLNWDDRAALHARPDSGYHTAQFRDPKHLSAIVEFDRPRLGDIAGQRVAHLQCHIGTDTLSLARLGATVTGLDFSPASVAAARALVAETGDKVDYVEANMYDARAALTGTFDMVYTGVGALPWLPDITRWAETVASLLAPGGRLFLREGHPILSAVDERIPDGPTLRFPYFNAAPVEWDDDATYVDTGGEKLAHTKTFEWNHGVGEVVTAVIGAGMRIEALVEHDSLFWEPMPALMEKRGEEWVMKGKLAGVMPLSYTLIARKEGAGSGAAS